LLKAKRDTAAEVVPLVTLAKDVPEAEQKQVFGTAAPSITSLARNDDDRQLITLSIASISWGQLMAAPPGTPDSLVAALRTAYMSAAADSAFKADVSKQQIEMNPISGQDTENLINAYLKTSPDLVQKYVTMLGIAR